MATVTLKGNALSTNGELPAIDSIAPSFRLTDKNLNDKSLTDFSGKKKLISIVPSLDTDVCAISTKKLNDAAKQQNEAIFIVISADLPFAQKRFCENESLNNVITLSEMRNKNFAKDYGVLLQDGPLAGITARAIIIIDENNKVMYTEMVSEITEEPNYEQALAALSTTEATTA